MERTFTPYFDNTYKRHYSDVYQDLRHLYIYDATLAEDFIDRVQRVKNTHAVDIHMFDSEMSIMQRYKKLYELTTFDNPFSLLMQILTKTDKIRVLSFACNEKKHNFVLD
jgi:hypothetical protein